MLRLLRKLPQKKVPDIVVLSNSFSGRGLAPRIGVKMEAGVADGAVALPHLSGGKFTIKKTAFSGKAFAVVELTRPTKLFR